MTTSEELDRLAQSYYLNPPIDVWLEERVQAWIMPYLAKRCRGHTLEMGYGTGVTTRMLKAAGVDVSVLEGSHLLRAEAMRAGATCWHAQFEDFGPGPTFDTVLCLHVLEHVDNPVRMLERIRSWLAPGGQVIVVTPNAYSLHRRVGRELTGDPVDTLSARDHLVGHRRVYSLRELCTDLAAVGFDTAGGTFGWFMKPVHNALMVDWSPELIDALCALGWDGDPHDAANIGVVGRA